MPQPEIKKWIHSDPAVMMGKPLVGDTRITVELILEKLAAGETWEQILSEHPRLTEEMIRAASLSLLKRYAQISSILSRQLRESGCR